MKKYKKIIIVALCVSLLLSMLSVSAFAAEETTVDNPVMPIDDETYVYYVPVGWSFEDFSFSGMGAITCFDVSTPFFGFEVSDGALFGSGFTLNTDDDFVLVSVLEIPYFSDYQIDLSLVYNTFYVASGWSVSEGFTDLSQVASLDFSINGIHYSDSSIYLGYVYEDDFVAFSDALVVSDSLSNPSLSLSSSDSFTFQLDDGQDPSMYLVYFLLHNGDVIVPESKSLTNDLFSVFGSVGSWISGAASSLVDMFWDGSSLTFVGILSVSALALSVIFLVLSFIERFLRFGG